MVSENSVVLSQQHRLIIGPARLLFGSHGVCVGEFIPQQHGWPAVGQHGQAGADGTSAAGKAGSRHGNGSAVAATCSASTRHIPRRNMMRTQRRDVVVT
jgi:hypothetical protein